MEGYDFGSIAMSGHNNSSFRCFLPCYFSPFFIFFSLLFSFSLSPFSFARPAVQRKVAVERVLLPPLPVFHGRIAARNWWAAPLDSFADRKFFNCADTELDLDFFNSNVYVFHRFNWAIFSVIIRAVDRFGIIIFFFFPLLLLFFFSPFNSIVTLRAPGLRYPAYIIWYVITISFFRLFGRREFRWMLRFVIFEINRIYSNSIASNAFQCYYSWLYTRNLSPAYSFPKFPIISPRIRWPRFSSFARAHVSPCMRTKTLKWTKDQSKIRRNSLPHRISSFEGGRELLLTELSLAAYLLTLLLAISKHSSISHATGRILLYMYCTHTHTHTYMLDTRIFYCIFRMK